MPLTNKKILFLSAKFFGYENEIVDELRLLGAEVLYFDERPGNTFLTKVFLRLKMKGFIQKNIERHYDSILAHEFTKEADYLFIISPETMSSEHLKRLRTVNPNIKVVAYYWDSIKNKNGSDFMLKQADRVLSFDKNDCMDFNNVNFLPLFYTRHYQAIKTDSKSISRQYGLYFVGTAHSDRYKLVKKIVTATGSKTNFLFFYSPSKILFFIKKVFDKNTRLMSFNDISFESLSKSLMFKALSESQCVIDIQHPKQTGLTMRTIEMLGAGRKLITTNSDVVNYDFYNSENILLIDRFNPTVPLSFLDSPYKEVDQKTYQKYSLNNWLKTIFEIKI